MHTSSSSNPTISASSIATATAPPTIPVATSSNDPTPTTNAMHRPSRHYHNTLLPPPPPPLPSSKTLRTSAIPKPVISKSTAAGSRKRALVDITNAHLSSTHTIGAKAASGRVGKHGHHTMARTKDMSKIPSALVKRQGSGTTAAAPVSTTGGMTSTKDGLLSSKSGGIMDKPFTATIGSSTTTVNAKQQQQHANEQQQPQRRASRRIAARRARHPTSINTNSTSTATASEIATRSSTTNSTAAPAVAPDSMLPIDRVARAVQTIKVDSATTSSFAAATRRRAQHQQEETMASKGTSMNTDIMSMTMSASTMTVPIATRTTANNMMTKNISSNGTVTNKTSSVHVQHINNQNNNTGRQAAIKKSVDEDGDVNLEATQVDDIEEEEEEELEVVANAVLQVANAPQQQSAATATAKQSGVSRIARRSAAANYALLDDVVYDIDIDDHSNCLTASAFAVAAHDNLRRSEECFYICSSSPSQSQQQSPPSSGTTYTTANATISSPPTYPRQSQISDRMRVVLLDWLVDVHHKHRLRSETLFLTVSILDRILHNLPIPRRSFQLVGMVSLWMASKFEDNIPPEVSDLVYVCDGAYSRTDVIREEARLLNVVEFKLNVPTILPFLRRAIKAAAKAGRFENAEIEEDVSCLARYVSEIALFCSKTRGVRPSLVAAAALSVAMGLLKVDLPWGRHMTMHTGWKKCEIVQVEDELVIATREEAAKTGRNSSSQSQGKTHGSQQQHQSDKLSALRRKFNSPRYCHIASRLPGLVLEYDIDTN